MKKCSKCGEEKEESEFNKRGNGLQPFCRKCNSEYQKDWHQKNAVYRREQIYGRRKEIKEWFDNIRKDNNFKCSVCGENRVATLDFHHRDPSKKDGNISVITQRGWSKSKILKEIEKCDILCANCHRMLHYEERNKS